MEPLDDTLGGAVPISQVHMIMLITDLNLQYRTLQDHMPAYKMYV